MKRNSKALLIVLIMIMCVASMFLVSCGKKYTVTMNDGGATTKEQVAENETYNLPTPTKTGYDFEGWYATEDFSGEALTQITVVADITVYAKWEKVYAVNLQLDGGSLSVSSVNLKDGENIYNAVKDLVPTKANAQFDAWTVGNASLSATQTINGADVTLTARYKYKYTVLAYEQTLDGEYEEVEGMVGYAYEGATVNPTLPAKDGFEKVEHANAINQVRIERDTNNICKLYYNRKTIRVTFKVEYPDGNVEDDYVVEVVYGNPVTVPITYTYTGYHLYAWQNSAATKTYKTNSINYYVNGSQADSESFVPATNETYYPVWVEGYKDHFGSNDHLFIFEDSDEYCYLVRGTSYFEGYYYPDTQEFEIQLDSTNLEGAIDPVFNTFFYYDTDRTGAYYSYTDREFNQNITMVFDKGNGVTYKENVGGQNQESKGTYKIENGEYIITFTSGSLKGQTKYAMVGTVSASESAVVKVFMFRNEKQYAYGTLSMIAMTEKDGLQINEGYYMTFDGYGNVTYQVTVGTNQGKGVYLAIVQSENEYVLVTPQNGQYKTVAMAKCITEEINGKMTTGFMLYNSSLNQTFVIDDGKQLKLDGYYQATYTENGKTVEGTYYYTKTQVATIAQFVSGKTVRKFALGSTNVMGENIYTAVELLNTYKELLYANKGTIYYAPLVVIDNNGAGTASVYGYATNNQYVKVSDGTYVYDKTTGKYTYTQTVAYSYTPAIYGSNDILISHGVAENPVKYSLIKSFVFSIESGTYTYEINYWYSYTDNNDQVVDMTKTYTTTVVVDEQGKEINYTLVAVNDTMFFLYDEDGNKINGVVYNNYSESIGEGVYVIRFIIGNQITLWGVKLNQDGTFNLYTDAPVVAAEYLSNGSTSNTSFIKFDGKNYTYEEELEDGTKVVYAGTVEQTLNSAPVSNAPIRIFNGVAEGGQNVTFEFVVLTSGANSFFARYNQTMSGLFYNANGEGSISLDGCAYRAQFTADGNTATVNCTYTITDKGEICLALNSNTGVYLKLTDLETKEYTYRGSEYGDYILIDNGNYLDTAYRIDGYGKVEIVVLGSEEPIVGTYTMSNGRCIVTYTDGANSYTKEGRLSTYATGGQTYRAFLVYHQEYVMTLTDSKNSTSISIDSYGAVTRYLADGKEEKGNATIISDTKFFYQSNDGTFGCIYTYDVATRKATASDYKTYNYYSVDLEGINFDKSGIVNYGDGIIRYYYVENGKAYICVYNPEDTQANDYGFVTETSFVLGFKIVVDDVEYNQTTGNNLNFAREAANADKYPITLNGNKYALESLSFKPAKTETYNVEATVIISGQSLKVNVSRVYNAQSEKYELYCSYGLLQFVIEVTFNGQDDASYRIVEMRENAVLYSSSYYYSKYVIEEDKKLGVHLDEIGYIELNGSYDEEGNVIYSRISTNFLEDSTVLDNNNNVINVQEMEYAKSGNTYVFECVAADGYKYRFNIKIGTSNYSNFYSAYEYSIISVSRLQEIENEVSGYYLNVGRVVAQKLSIAEMTNNPLMQIELGTINFAEIYYQGEFVQTISLIGDITTAVAVYREVESGKVTRTVYYNIACREAQSDLTVKLFESFSITPEEVETIYDETGTKFIDARSNGTILLFYYPQNGVSSVFNVTTSSYDANTNSYVFVSGEASFMALISGEGSEKVARIEWFTTVKSGADTIYFDASANIILIKYDDTFYRADGDNYGWNSAGIYEFTANGSNFVIVKTTTAAMTTYDLHKVEYAQQSAGKWVAINTANNEIVYVCDEFRIYVATSSTYDEAKKTYTVQTAVGTYVVKVDGDNVTIEKQH